MAIALTDKQADVLEFITLEIQKGLPPTVREVARAFSISSRAGYDQIKAIEKKGYIHRGSMDPRDIALTAKALAEGWPGEPIAIDLSCSDIDYAIGRAHDLDLPSATDYVRMPIERDRHGSPAGEITLTSGHN
jgi:SOS-response transcriptional repressor LexA